MPAFGWKGFIPDNRDDQFSYRTIAKAVEVPDVYYGWHPPMLDQDDIGACGPHALVTLAASVQVQNDMPDWVQLSPWALYYFYREQMNEIGQDSGVWIRELLKVMADSGAPERHLWDDPKQWDTKPPAEVYADASRHQILSYHAINNLEEMINCIAEGYGFIGGIPVYESFMNVGPSGYVPMYQRGEKFLGGHALYFHSYDKHKKVIWFQNSWSNDWGREGHGALPFEYPISDCWTIRLLEG